MMMMMIDLMMVVAAVVVGTVMVGVWAMEEAVMAGAFVIKRSDAG